MKINKITLIVSAIAFSFNAIGQTNDDLSNACKSGNLASVKSAIENGSNSSAIKADGSPIMTDAMFYPDIIKYLIDNGADPNAGTSPILMSAAGSYCTETVKVLIENGADVNKPQIKTEYHPIANLINVEKAKAKPNKKVLKIWQKQLAAAGGNMDPTETKTSILGATVKSSNAIGCIKLLLDNGAKVNETDALGLSILDYSVSSWSSLKNNFISYGKTLGGYGYVVPAWFEDEVNKGSSLEETMLLLEAGADINYFNTVLETSPLLNALGAHNKKGSKLLIDRGADVNIQTPNKKTILSSIMLFADLELVKMVVEKGADVNAESWELDQISGQIGKGFTPLTLAVVNDKVDIAKYLIEQGSKPKEGVSGYHISKKTGCPYKLKNKTAIYYAIENNNMEMVKMLTENFNKWKMHKMEMKQPDNTSTIDIGNITIETTSCWKIKGIFTPSVYAKKLGHKEISSYLKSKGL